MESIPSAVRVALDSLFAHKGRFLLTSLGIVIGIGLVIALVSAGSGARQKLARRLANVGTNVFLIRPGGRTASGTVADYHPVSRDDADAVRKDLGPLLLGVAPIQVSPRLLSTGARIWHTTVVGTTPDVEVVENWKLLYGRFFNTAEDKKMAPVCVIGQTVRKKLFPERPNAVGQRLRAGHLQLTVIGVLARKGRNPLGTDEDDQIFIPLNTLEHKLVGREDLALIMASARTEDLLEFAKEKVIRVLRQRHHLSAGAGNDFDVSTVQELAQFAVVMTGTMQVLITIIASISLVVGGIGIMNIAGVGHRAHPRDRHPHGRRRHPG
jgi:putative ABC transport system permease protein